MAAALQHRSGYTKDQRSKARWASRAGNASEKIWSCTEVPAKVEICTWLSHCSRKEATSWIWGGESSYGLSFVGDHILKGYLMGEPLKNTRHFGEGDRASV